MAKKKAVGGQSYQADKEQVPLTPQEMRDWAQSLRGLADTLELHAGDLDALEIDSIVLFVKGFTNGLTSQKLWMSKQFLPKLMSTAADKGAELKVELKRAREASK